MPIARTLVLPQRLVRAGAVYARFLAMSRSGRFTHAGMAKAPMMLTLSGLATLYGPKRIVQLGLGQGAWSIALLLGARLSRGTDVSLIGYDNFAVRAMGDVYDRNALERNLDTLGLRDAVDVRFADVLAMRCPFDDIDLLCVDIDNTYEKLVALRDLGWFDGLSPAGVIVIEGGISKHDHRAESRGITGFCREMLRRDFQALTLPVYPGLLVMRKLRPEDAAF